MKKLPIGLSDFKSIIQNGFYYIDKTNFISELLNNGASVILLPRPRRFGKTLNLSMLRYFFDINENNQELFQNLNISKNSEAMAYLGKYPVIYITFKDIKENNFESAFAGIKYLINKIISQYEKKINPILDKLDQTEKKHYERLNSEQGTDTDYKHALKLLSKLLRIAYNQKCIILIDEYDTPIQTGFLEGYYKEIVSFFKTFMCAVLKDNDENVYKSVLTGILRVSKESIFSDLNNIEVHTLLDKDFSDKFGFTIDEVKQLLTDYNLIDKFQEVNKWYNGYLIGDTTIFNPWSLLNFTADKKFDVYWANTSSNGIIKTLVENSKGFRQDLELLLNEQTVEKTINPNITFQDKNFNFKEEMLYSFLFFSGYLKYTQKDFKRGKHICKLAIVNIECQYIFENIISNWIEDSFENNKLRVLLKSLIEGDLKLFQKIFSEFVRDTLSFYDTGKNVEAVYHAFLLGLLVNLSDYEIISNQEAGYGRVDIILLHKTDKNRLAIIIELKTIDEFEEETKEKALENAVKQIQEKEYIALVQKRGYENILSFGVVFDGKRVWVKQIRSLAK